MTKTAAVPWSSIPCRCRSRDRSTESPRRKARSIMNDETSDDGLPTAPYADLTPTSVLDALDGVGLRGDGRMLQLNSYENRVFQAFLEDGRVVVAKFYRPGRWTDAQILEEHAFTAELATVEIPVAAPLALAADAASPHAAAIAAAGPTLAIAA